MEVVRVDVVRGGCGGSKGDIGIVEEVVVSGLLGVVVLT